VMMVLRTRWEEDRSCSDGLSIQHGWSGLKMRLRLCIAGRALKMWQWSYMVEDVAMVVHG
jgi:hypothetical protein